MWGKRGVRLWLEYASRFCRPTDRQKVYQSKRAEMLVVGSSDEFIRGSGARPDLLDFLAGRTRVNNRLHKIGGTATRW